MAEKENEEFEQHSKAFNKALHDLNWIALIEQASWLLENLSKDAPVERKLTLYDNRAAAYSNLKQKQFALDDYQKVLEIKPDDPFTYSNISAVHVSFGEYNEALPYIEKAIELKQNNEGLLINRGYIYSALGQYEKAIADYNEAIDVNPLSFGALNNRGATYTRLNNHEKAIDDFSKAINLKPNDASSYVNRGNALGDLGEFDKALKDYTKALELDPSNLVAVQNITLARASLETERIVQIVKQDYEERLKAVTDPKEIDDRFQERKKEASERLKKLRDESDKISYLLVLSVPFIWGSLLFIFGFDGINLLFCLEPRFDFEVSLPFILASISLLTMFLHFPLFARLAYLNRNARIERHVLEDYDRKSVMLLIRNLEGENVNTVLKHYKSNGTPEVLNKLYHPKHAYKEAETATSQNLLERIESLLKQIIGKPSP